MPDSMAGQIMARTSIFEILMRISDRCKELSPLPPGLTTGGTIPVVLQCRALERQWSLWSNVHCLDVCQFFGMVPQNFFSDSFSGRQTFPVTDSLQYGWVLCDVCDEICVGLYRENWRD